MITLDGRVESNGNFHGAPVGYVLDFLAIAVADVAGMSERRTDRFLDAARSNGLPPFLADDAGVDSGHMIAQYTAAGIVSELKRLAVPASVDSIPSSAMQEDHVSMGWHAARKLRRAVDGLTRVLAIEILTAARALDLRAPLEPAAAHRAPSGTPSARPASPGPGPTATSPRRSRPSSDSSTTGALLTATGIPPDLKEPTMDGARPVRAPRGTTLTARSWQTEAPLRMLQNNLDPEVAERPDDLVVYGGTGRAARDWRSFDAMVRTLTTLADDETMLVQSGRPVGVLRTHEWAPRVLIANSNLVGDWATWPEFRRLEHLGLTMYGQMTAGSWIYIGTQGILQGTYETFAAVAAKRFGGTLAGTLTLTGGCGGMGGAQPLAVTLNGGVCLVVDVDETRLRRRVDPALPRRGRRRPRRRRRALPGREARPSTPLSVGVVGNAATVFPELLRRGVEIDIVTDQTSAHDPLSYLPEGVDLDDWHDYAEQEARGVHRPGPRLDGQARRGDGRLPGRRRRGLRLRQLDPRRGPPGRLRARLRLPRLRARLHPAAVLRGQGPVPLGRALRRPGGHRRHRPRRPRPVPRQRPPAALDPRRPGQGRLPGAAGPDLLARATASATSPGCGSTRWSPPGRSARRS